MHIFKLSQPEYDHTVSNQKNEMQQRRLVLPFRLYTCSRKGTDRRLRRMAARLQAYPPLLSDYEECLRSMEHLSYEPVPGKGFGVRCVKRLERGRVIAIYTGEIAYMQGERITDNLTAQLEFDDHHDAKERVYIRLTGSRCEGLPPMETRAQNYNHRCRHPNCSLIYHKVFIDNATKDSLGYMMVKTRQRVEEGEELTYDYGDSVVMTAKAFQAAVRELPTAAAAVFKPCLCHDCRGKCDRGFLEVSLSPTTTTRAVVCGLSPTSE